jgi:hypothetical protein
LPQARWVEQQMERVLPVKCFHVVFTLPAELRPLARRQGRDLYELLPHAASSTLLTLGRANGGAVLQRERARALLTARHPMSRAVDAPIRLVNTDWQQALEVLDHLFASSTPESGICSMGVSLMVTDYS